MSNIRSHVSLGTFNTFGISAKARWLLEVNNEAQAIEFIIDNASNPIFPILILGGGSNLLFTKDYPGLVIKNQILGKEVSWENEDELVLKVGAGENWHQLILYCLQYNWGGIENLSLIPGLVGAAPVQNIGAYGIELKDVFAGLEAIHMQTGQLHIFDKEGCKFGYRDSVFKQEFKDKFLITRISLRLTKRNHLLNTTYGSIGEELKEMGISKPGIRDISNAVIRIRQSKLPDPAEIGNGGSFFKNSVISTEHFDQIIKDHPDMPNYPLEDGSVKIPSAWLIQSCGWKGKRFGNYGVHPRQALVLVNYGGANGQDIFDLSAEIMQDVKKRFGISLEREINVVA